MALRYITLDVFTDRPFSGNPLAVFCDQPELPTERMQAIAREFNLSETVFIVPPRDPRALRRLRIFTPAKELPFAGHPTIGAAHTLVDAGLIADRDEFALELEVGLVPIKVTRRDGQSPYLQLTAARIPETRGTAPSRADLARILSLQEDDVLDGPMASECEPVARLRGSAAWLGCLAWPAAHAACTLVFAVATLYLERPCR